MFQLGKKPDLEQIPIPVNRTGIYARLSLYDMNHTDRDSIQNQLMILTDYMDQHPELNLTEQYIDNGWSGTNFQRPAFLQMIDDIQEGKINCIVTKDLSRLGRNYMETGYYLETLFPMLHVRYISINDGYDSATSEPGQLAVILKNILNDFFSRDLSRRYSASYDLRKEQGVFRKGLPYGYAYDPERPKHMTYDDHVAHFVRLIFAWALEGVGNHTIAMRLRELNAPTQERIEYLRSGGRTCHKGTSLWSAASVRQILTNRIYTGDFVCGKRYNRLCDPYNRRPSIPEEEWVIIPDSHPAYISKEDFSRIQDHMKDNVKKRREIIKKNQEGRPVEENYYKRIIFCGVCGNRIHICRDGVASRDKCALYHCQGYATSRHPVPHRISIHKKLLDVIVLDQLQNQFHLARQFTDWLKSSAGKHCVSTYLHNLEVSLEDCRRDLESLSLHRTQIFEAYADALLDKDSYLQEMNHIRDKKHSLSLQIEKDTKELETVGKAFSPSNPWLVIFTSTPSPVLLNEKVTHSLIDRIELAESWQVTIHFKEEKWFLPLQNLYESNLPQTSTEL